MTGGRAKRRAKQKWRNKYAHRIKAINGGLCLNCGQPGAHFVPPSFGDRGFFICKPQGEVL